jgi:chemotaxis protein methyltransferase CheR
MTTSWLATMPELSDRDLSAIARLVYAKSGINLHQGKRALVAARLQKRLRHGGFHSFRQYIRYLQSDDSGDELTAMLDAIATNHTAFFREPRHFEYLSQTVLPPLIARGGAIRAWSAGCATGEEPYTIAIVLLERLGGFASRQIRLLATDLSTKALAAAASGVYKVARLQDVPHDYPRKYFVRDTSQGEGHVRVAAAVRTLVEFRQLNLLQPEDTIAPQDFIFCRNVMIYFDRDVQQRVIGVLERRLAPGGYLFVSHSESLSGVTHGLRWVAPSIYQRGMR